jgi:serine/threonine-protein kinase PpkA
MSAEVVVRRRPVRLVLLVGLMVGLLPIGATAAQGREALLMPGKSSPYQRVLTRPGAVVRHDPGGQGRTKASLPPLSVLFVFERRMLDGREWLEIGFATAGATYGWIPADQAIDRKQTLTVAFTRTAEREPALFFREREALVSLMESEHLVRDVDRFRDQIRRSEIPPGFPVISIEPDTYVACGSGHRTRTRSRGAARSRSTRCICSPPKAATRTTAPPPSTAHSADGAMWAPCISR